MKISDLVEFSFSETSVAAHPLAALAEQLRGLPENASAPEYASMMTSYSSIIIEAVRGVRKIKDQVLVVDLGEGRAWIPPNLYFLALLASTRTSVQQIAFVETLAAEEIFIAMSSPEEVVEGLANALPVLQDAREKSNCDDEPLSRTGPAFFGALAATYQMSPTSQQVKDMSLSGPTLYKLLQSRLHRERVDLKETVSETEYRCILTSNHPYIAAVKDDQLQFLIDRDRFALLLARQLL